MISPSQDIRPRTANLLLIAILVVGLALRVWSVNFDQGIGSHPDERSTACFYAPTIHLPDSWEQFLDPTASPLNPLWNLDRQERRSFTYGHFPLYLGVAMGDALHLLAPLAERVGMPEPAVALMARAHEACDAIAVAGRLTIALLDTLTIFLLYLLGARMYGRRGALLAAAFYAFAAEAVQLSHFFAMDPASTTFTVLAVLGSVMIVQDRSWRAIVVSGVGAGLAISSKFSALPILAAPVVACLLVLYDEWQRNRQRSEVADGRAQLTALLGIPVALLIALVLFFVSSPYALLDWRSFLQATLIEQGRMVRGIADMPFTRQYRNTLPYIYFIQQQMQWGLGWALGAVTAAGVIWSLLRLLHSGYSALATFFGARVRLISQPALGELVVWSWLIPYFGLTGAFLAKFNRYMSPVLPFVLLFGAGLIVWLWTRGSAQSEESPQTSPPQHPNPFARAAAIALVVLGVVGGLLWSLAYVNGVYNREHTWISASRWIYQNAPAGSVILWELWDDPLPKAVPGEPGMDMGATGLTNIDWSPYEEDTAEKYEILKQKLREADYVAYSSKRIYDSVDELPARYPMTNLYYEAMWDDRLGFELAHESTSPPQLFGFGFDDRHADESWSLYDHPQATIFRKVRDLSDEEFDALFAGAWQKAIPWDRGPDSAFSPFLNLIGLGQSEESANRGLINRVIGLLSGEETPQVDEPPPANALMLVTPLADLPVVDNYRWNEAASTNPWLAVLWWWLVVALLGWLAWPLAFAVLQPLRDRGYLFSRALGWLVAGWLLWWLASLGWLHNTVLNAWLMVGVLALAGAVAAVMQRKQLARFLRTNWGLLLAGELLFAVAYLFFVGIRLFNPDIWQPWFGGEKFMEFAFLNGILRSPTFPPVDPHFAGGYINYYYFGLYLVAYLIKLTGIYAEVAFNLAIPTLFALTVVNSFAVAYSAVRAGADERQAMRRGQVASEPLADSTQMREGAEGAGESSSDAAYPESGQLSLFDEAPLEASPVAESAAVASDGVAQPVQRSAEPALPWRVGFLSALLAPLFVVIIGNLDGAAQLLRNLVALSSSQFASALPGVQSAVLAVDGLRQVLSNGATLRPYDFWGPSRVIPNTINEFPYWSFLFADLHPHLIGIPFAALFLGLVLALLRMGATNWRHSGWRGAALLLSMSLLLGALASVNLWELPTYLALGALGFVVSQWWGRGRIDCPFTVIATLLYAGLTYLLFAPFFLSYTNIGASGVGLVRAGDDLSVWLLIWGFLAFVLFSWLVFAAAQPARPAQVADGIVLPTGSELLLSLSLRQFDRLPRMVSLHQRLVTQPAIGYLVLALLLPLAGLAMLAAWWLDRSVLALLLAPLALAFVLLWRRGHSADAGSQFALLLSTTGLALLAGTQLVFLKDFLQGGDWQRMNTLFKFFSQVWVIWGIAAAIALPRFWRGWVRGEQKPSAAVGWRWAWGVLCALLLAGSLAFLVWGTPARLDQRLVGWQPPLGTLNGMEYMREGRYTWPDDSHEIDLRYDWQAINWLLDHVRGNAVIAESSEVDYYRAGSSRVASLTGLSALRGMHESEQRFSEQLRDAMGCTASWSTPDVGRMQQLIDELQIDLIYVGQLERFLHPDALPRLEQLAAEGKLDVLYQNDMVTIYGVSGRLECGEGAAEQCTRVQ